MIAAVTALILAAAPATAPGIEDLGEGRYRVTIVYAGSSVRAQVQAQLRLGEAAERHCRAQGHGGAVIDALEVNGGPRRGQHRLGATFTCQPR